MANRRCRQCREYSIPKDAPKSAFTCSPECALAYVRKRQAKDRAKVHKAKVRNFRMQDKSHQIELTRKAFNTMIRLLDRGKLCPTCGEPLIEGEYDAGHVRTVASCPQLRFDARACFGQCRKCNGSGTIRKRTRKTQEVVSELYKQWILDTFGQEYYDWLYGPHPSPNWTIEDLIAMRMVFLEEIRRLQAGQPPSREWRKL